MGSTPRWAIEFIFVPFELFVRCGVAFTSGWEVFISLIDESECFQVLVNFLLNY